MKTLQHRVEQLEEQVNSSDEVIVRFADPANPDAPPDIPPGFKGEVIVVHFVDPDRQDPR
jgi:hypothetical protein